MASLKSATKRPVKPERTVQRSVSLRPSQWERLDVLADLTRWGRSGALAVAVELLTALPVTATQRVATLLRDKGAATFRARFRAAVEEAVAAAEDKLGDDPHAELRAALLAVRDSVRESPAAEMSEKELIAAADAAKRARRQKRHGRAASAGRSTTRGRGGRDAGHRPGRGKQGAIDPERGGADTAVPVS